MRKINLYLLLSLLIALSACEDDDNNDDLLGNWVKLGTQYETKALRFASAFTIGDSAYVCTGYNGESEDHYKTLYMYSPSNDYWVQKADFPGDARNKAVAFAIDNYGYVGTGANNINQYNDFYRYSPVSNSWDAIASFPGVERYEAFAFSAGGKGYVGGGYDGDASYLSEFYEYDPSTNSWEKKPSVPGDKRRGSMAFVIDGVGYVCSGLTSSTYSEYFHAYDPSTNSWTALHELEDDDDASFDDDYNEIPRAYGAAFSVEGKGYIVAGTNGSALSTVWEYDPTTDRWDEKTGLEYKGTDQSRIAPVSFVLNNIAYVGMGYLGSTDNANFYKFEPFEDEDEDD